MRYEFVSAGNRKTTGSVMKVLVNSVATETPFSSNCSFNGSKIPEDRLFTTADSTASCWRDKHTAQGTPPMNPGRLHMDEKTALQNGGYGN